jgi:hypothetical protein
MVLFHGAKSSSLEQFLPDQIPGEKDFSKRHFLIPASKENFLV